MVFEGVILRGSHGVAQVKWVTGNKILRILKSKGLVEYNIDISVVIGRNYRVGPLTP